MTDPTLVQLSGSERAPLANATPAGAVNTAQRVELTLVLRRRAELPYELIAGPEADVEPT